MQVPGVSLGPTVTEVRGDDDGASIDLWRG